MKKVSIFSPVQLATRSIGNFITRLIHIYTLLVNVTTIEAVTEGRRRFMAAWRQKVEEAVRHRQEKREATRLGKLQSHTEAYTRGQSATCRGVKYVSSRGISGDFRNPTALVRVFSSSRGNLKKLSSRGIFMSRSRGIL